MKVQFNKENTKKVLEGYYKEVEGGDTKIEIITTIGSQRFCDIESANVCIKLIHSIPIYGQLIESERELPKDEVKEVFGVVLRKEGYQVEDITYDARVSTGCYIWDQGEKSSYFNGITVSMKKKENQKIKGGK